MYTVDLYLRVRLACHVDGLSQREAASRFGIGMHSNFHVNNNLSESRFFHFDREWALEKESESEKGG